MTTTPPAIQIEVLYDRQTLGEFAISVGLAAPGTAPRIAAQAMIGEPLPRNLQRDIHLVTGAPLTLTSVSVAAVHGLASDVWYNGLKFAIQVSSSQSENNERCALKNLAPGLTSLIRNAVKDHFKDLGVVPPQYGIVIEDGQDIRRTIVAPDALEAAR